MIEINLLPPEHRPVERTPLPRLLTILTGVLLTMAELVLCAWLTVLWIPAAEARRNKAKSEEAAKADEADKVKELEEELETYRKREGALARLFKERIRWTRVLDRLADARKTNPDVVLTTMELKKASVRGIGRRRGATTMQLHIQGYVPSFADHAVAARLSKACMAFVGTLRKDPQWQKMFEEQPKYKKFHMDERLGGTSRNKKPGLPKAGLRFHVIFTMKAVEAAQPGTASTAHRKG